MTGLEFVWIFLCVACASFAQSISGFGFALLSVPLMQLVLDPRDAVVISTFIGAVSTTTQAILDRKDAQQAVVKRLTLASYVGMPFGLAIFVVVSDTTLRIVLGVVVVAAAVLLSRGFQLHQTRHVIDWIMGIVSGMLATSTSTNGPPLVFLMQARNMPSHEFRSSINSIFSFVNVGAIAMFVASGNVSLASVVGAVIALPALFFSLKLGYSVRPRVSETLFRRSVLGLLYVSGLSLFIRAFV